MQQIDYSLLGCIIPLSAEHSIKLRSEMHDIARPNSVR
jgi:hypothetical protein